MVTEVTEITNRDREIIETINGIVSIDPLGGALYEILAKVFLLGAQYQVSYPFLADWLALNATFAEDCQWSVKMLDEAVANLHEFATDAGRYDEDLDLVIRHNRGDTNAREEVARRVAVDE